MVPYTYSSSKWERSYYGGFTSIIWDHPDVKTGENLKYETPKWGSGDNLGSYTAEKLLDIFLIKSKENKLFDLLAKDPEIQTKESLLGFMKTKYAIIRKEAQRIVLDCLIEADNEYRSLFSYYRKTIEESDIMIELPPENQEKSKAPVKGEPVSGESGKCIPDPSGEDLVRYVSDELEKTKKKEKFSGSQISGSLKNNVKWFYPTSTTKITFSAQNEEIAKKIVSLLDITFDPKQDRINSLRTGKLDARKIAEVLPGNLNVYYKIEEDQTTKPFSVVILQDESGSMRSGGKMAASMELLKILYLAFTEILPPKKLSIYGHSGDSTPDIYIYQDMYHPNFEASMPTMCYKLENYDGPVIEAIYERTRDQTDDNILFIVLSDGQPAGEDYGSQEDRIDLRRIVEKCRRDGFVTIGLGIKYDTEGLYDYNCTISNLGADMIKKTTHTINTVVKKEFQ